MYKKQGTGVDFPKFQRIWSSPEYLEYVPKPIKGGDETIMGLVSEERSCLAGGAVLLCSRIVQYKIVVC